MRNNLIKTAGFGRVTATLLAASILVGCGESGQSASSGQVAVKVNGTEISIHQLNHVLGSSGNIPPAELESVRKQALERLVDQELLAAKAVEEKLDRSPKTLLAIEQARREILARAYMEQVLAAAGPLQRTDISRYYYQNPELFAERKLYNLEELSFPVSELAFADVQAQVGQGATLESLQAQIEQKGGKVRRHTGATPAEKLPLAFIKEVHQAKVGDIVVLHDTRDISVLRVLATQTQPVSEADAAPAIQQYLMNKRIAELQAKQLKPLRDQAKIEYLGSFAAQAGTAAVQPEKAANGG